MDSSYFLVGALVVALLSPLFFFRPKDPFQPEFFLNIYFITLIGIGPVAIFVAFPDRFDDFYGGALYLIMLSFLSINFGFFVSRVFFADNPSGFSFQGRSIAKSSFLKYFSVVLFIVGLVSSLIFYVRSGQVPLLQADKEMARVAALSVSGNGYFLYGMTLLQIACCIALYFCVHVGKNGGLVWSRLLFVIVLCLISGVVLTGTGSRRYFAWIIIYGFIFYNYRVRIISIKSFLILVLGGLVVVSLFEMFRNPDSTTTESLGVAVLYRFGIYASNLDLVLSEFSQSSFLYYGKTFFMDILTALPGKQVDYQSWLKEMVGMDFEGFGIPPTIVGDSYINFGVLGVVFISFLYGFLGRFVYHYFVLSGKGKYGLLLYALILEVMCKLLSSGLSAQAMSILWLFFVFLAYVVMRSVFIKAV